MATDMGEVIVVAQYGHRLFGIRPEFGTRSSVQRRFMMPSHSVVRSGKPAAGTAASHGLLKPEDRHRITQHTRLIVERGGCGRRLLDQSSVLL